MPPRLIQFKAVEVDCGEAMDCEIVQVCFDSVKDDPDADYRERASAYLMLSINFEFEEEDNDGVQLEFHDGHDYDGGYCAAEIDLWRDRVRVVAEGGPEFDVGFKLSDKAFTKLRKFLKILFRKDCFRG